MDIYEKKESGNDLALAEYWASLGEVYINDALDQCIELMHPLLV